MVELASILTKELSIKPATLIEVDESGDLFVEEEGMVYKVAVLRTSQAPLPDFQEGDQVLVALSRDCNVAYILGIIEPLRSDEEVEPTEGTGKNIQVIGTGRAEVVRVKGRRIHLEAGDEIQITCGGGKISIDRTGKIVVRGNNVVSRAKQTHRIKGGSVAIN